MRVAYYSPLPPQRSGIADYSALLLPALRKHVDITLARPSRPRPPADVALYQLGNDPEAHGWIYETLRTRRGLVVMHEVSLHGLVAGLTLGRGDRDAYLEAVELDAGDAGRLAAERALSGLAPPLWETRPEEFPLIREALGLAEGLVVHSGYAELAVRAAGYEGPVHRIPLAARPGGHGGSPISLHGDPVIGSLGKINHAKRIPQLLHAFARLRDEHPQALLVLAGAGARTEQMRLRLDELGLEPGTHVLLLDYMGENDFHALAAACDICVNLRGPTLGETSASAIAALAAGTPLVVSDVGWFSELPDWLAAKVPVDEWEIDHLAAVLGLLASDPALRKRMGHEGVGYVRRELDVEGCAEGYANALREVVDGEAA